MTQLHTWNKLDDEQRKARSLDEMAMEAAMLRVHFHPDDKLGKVGSS